MNVAQGGTIRLPAIYRDGAGALVDPTLPHLEIMDPSGASIVSGLAPVRESLGEYHYDYTVASGAPVGSWTARWTGIIGGSTLLADDTFDVVLPGTINTAAPSLLSLAELKSLLGIQPANTSKDAQYEALISPISTLVRTYTQRDFAAPTVTETRTFEYDGSGFLDIDDASAVTLVEAVAPTPQPNLTLLDWSAEPLDGEGYGITSYIRMPALVPWSGSPYMGFTQNLDRLYEEGRWPIGDSVKIAVTGTWGWPEVPDDIKLAAAWAVQDMASRPAGDALTAESIASYSRSWAATSGLGSAALSGRVRDILSAYAKVTV